MDGGGSVTVAAQRAAQFVHVTFGARENQALAVADGLFKNFIHFAHLVVWFANRHVLIHLQQHNPDETRTKTQLDNATTLPVARDRVQMK
jgi:hypothetical protein